MDTFRRCNYSFSLIQEVNPEVLFFFSRSKCIGLAPIENDTNEAFKFAFEFLQPYIEKIVFLMYSILIWLD